jgi:signal transduction histidine kinase
MSRGTSIPVLMPHLPAPHYSAKARCERLAYLDFTPEDAARLCGLRQLIEQHLPAVVEQFYQHLLAFEPTRSVLSEPAMVERLKAAQQRYLLSTVQGTYDASYFQCRWISGDIHNAIQLEPHWYIGAFQLYHRILYPLILEHHRDDPQAVVDHILALDKIMNLDMQLGIESYMAHYAATMEQLQHLNVQIEAASAAKSQFMANMSHEFRTPLNAIIGFTEVLHDEIPGPLNEEQREYLGYIYDGGQHLLRLINDVLDLAKVEAGRLELFYETFPIAQVVREALTTFKGEAEKRQNTLVAELPPGLGVITADQVRFKQILYNLVSNGVKFTSNGNVTVSARTEDGMLHLAVADTGIGIKPEDRDQIFVEFGQVGIPAQQQKGTGLGLALTKRLVEAHEGRIWYDSEFGRGSVFHVVLPLQPPRRASSTPDPGAPAAPAVPSPG